VAPARLTFTKDNWKAPQQVLVTGVDDARADGAQSFEVQFSPAESKDKGYAGMALSPVQLSNVDNDTAGITVTDVSGATTEAGAQATFTVALNSEPRSTVTLTVDSSDKSEGTVSPTTLTFTPANWKAPQTVTVTGVDDEAADGQQTYSISFLQAASEDSGYSALTPRSVSVKNTDNDTAGFTVSAASGPTTEAGGQASFSVVLNSQPADDVTVHFGTSDLSEGQPSTDRLTFTPVNWKAPQQVLVTGVNDDLVDGNQPYSISFSATTGGDAAYVALTPSAVAFSNTDDDSAGLTVSALSGPTTEAGGQASFTVALTSEPVADVTLAFQSSDMTEGTLSTSSLTFTAQNWKAPQTVLVTGINDDLADGNQPYSIVFGATTSTDTNYSGLVTPNLSVSNTDDDSAGITVSALSGATTEAGDQASFTVVLNSEPYADVTLAFQSSDTTEGTLSTSSLTFTAQNWKAPQTVLVTGVNDDLADGNQPYAITFGATTSTDAAYAGITPANVSASNTDNDSAGITVSALSGATTEAGGQASFTVVLTSQPYDSVKLALSSSNTAEGTLSTPSLTFTAQNWKAPQTVLVTGVNDDRADGNQPYTITFAPSMSADPAYNNLTPMNVSASNTDNDSAGITVSAISGATTEAGGQASFTVVLTSEPYANVTLAVSSSNTAEGTLSTPSLTFTAQNWNAPQTVLVTGVNDNRVDGNQPYAITFAPSTSTDAAYNNVTPMSVQVSNTDDDSAGFKLVASGNTTEGGGQATLAISLTSEPYSNVTLSFASSDTTEATTSASSVTFTAQNWNAPQTVLLTGVNDNVADGNQPYSLAFSGVASNDAAYAALLPANVGFSNQDDDTAGLSVSAASGTTNEAGGTATFSVVLTSEPLANVTVSFQTGDASEGTLSASSFVFTPANWNAPKLVTVTGVNDNVADGNQFYSVVFSASTSADPAYAGITPANVVLVNTDDDSAGVNVSMASGSTSEAGGTATFSVVLTSEPFANVTLNFGSSDTTEGTTNISSLLFNTANWNMPQSVTVTGVNDALADGNQPYTITFGPTQSSDAAYAAITPANVNVLNLDDSDTAGITVSPVSGDTTEAGGTATFTVVLNSQPFANVTVNVHSSDTAEGTLSTSAVLFTPANWSEVQTVTVTGVDDTNVDGDQPYGIVFAPTSSADPAYAAITPANLLLKNLDDDSVLLSWNFDSGLQGWTVSNSSATVRWNVDADPEGMPGSPVHTGAGSLNYNDGVDFDDGVANNGTVTSPLFGLGSFNAVQLTFWCNYQTETDGTSYDRRYTRIHRQGPSGLELVYEVQHWGGDNSAGACSSMGTWHTHTINLDPNWGSIQVSFAFHSIDHIGNNGGGWFIDDAAIVVP
jgi:hypothetical protein